MITRIWHGQTAAEETDCYLDFLKGKGTADFRRIAGNTGVTILRKREKTVCHFLVVTHWTDVEAIKQFAGDDIQKAFYYPEDADLLQEVEEHVKHYESWDVSASKLRAYIRQLEQTMEGGSWQGESFREKLRDVDDELAFSAPAPGVHTIAELVWHCIYWRTVLIRRMLGDHSYREDTMQQLNFLPADELRAKGWPELKQELDESQAVLIKMLRTSTDAFLAEEYQPGYSFEHHLLGIIQHDIYHLGQIGLLKRMLAG